MSAAFTRGPIMIAAGGTGGHVMPALAVARELRERGEEIVWIGTRRGLESRLVPAADIAIDWMTVEGLRGKGVLKLLLAPVTIARALWQAWRIMSRRKPRAVLGMGGFVSGPAGLVAWLRRCPLIVHEQNAIAGMTNRLLAPLSTCALQAMEGALREPSATVGNPLRRELLDIERPEQRFAGRSGSMRILVVGGSQGAQVLNRVVPAALARVQVPCDVRHQTGANLRFETEADYAQCNVSKIRVFEFIDDMPEALAWADLVICRSGAMTVAELAATGVGAILVPFPYAVDDHQTANAGLLVGAGAALLCPEADFSESWLAEALKRFSEERALLARMAVQARACAKPRATSDVTDAILEVAS